MQVFTLREIGHKFPKADKYSTRILPSWLPEHLGFRGFLFTVDMLTT